jgi:hypothetical protein
MLIDWLGKDMGVHNLSLFCQVPDEGVGHEQM